MAIHQGGILKNLVDKNERLNTDLAALWGISEATLYNYYKMEIIPSKKLIDICKKMGWDYIKLFHHGINAEKEFSENEQLKSKIASLKRENELLQDQVDQLKYMVGMIKKKPATKK